MPKPLNLKQMPAFHIQQASDATLQVLLELILHFDFLAKELEQNDDVTALIPDTPLGHAINMVLAQTAEGEWELAEQSIINSELVANPSIGKILNDPEFSRHLPEDSDSKEVLENKRERVTAAFNDCVNEMIRNDLDMKIAEISQAMRTASGEELVRMQRDCCELIARKNRLKKR